MRSVITATLFLTLSAPLVACDDPVAVAADHDGGISLRTSDYGGCEYKWTFNWNDDYPNAPAECAMKLAMCADVGVQHCNSDPQSCYLHMDHCWQWIQWCWKSTGEL